ncbi:MAG: hypothetical protein NVS4B10_13410 [Myxococcales bacterium]
MSLRTVASGIETPASVARSEKPASTRPVSFAPSSVRAATKLRPSTTGKVKPEIMLSVSRGRPRWGANTLL